MADAGKGHRPSLDRATLWAEWPVRRLTGSHRLNPLPHAGTITVFLFGVVVVTGLYLTLFFRYGFEGSYEAVAAMEAHPIQRFARALHRYASAAMVVTTSVHGWRILAARRYVGGRRPWRWTSGVLALALVWLAGVTGYWLIWDVRAQAITEIYAALTSRFGPGAAATLLVPRATSGATILLVIWLAHLGLSAVIGYALHRHLRRSQLSWLPPHQWMALMGGALALTSLALPVGMLSPADPERMVSDLPIDPFVLFLLPPLLTELRWLALAAMLITLALGAALPRLLLRRQPPVIEVDEAACTGCELCVIDCPYLALSMTAVGDPDAARPVAVVDEAACVGCGICLGSCAFGALDLPGTEPAPGLDEVAGRRVVIACDRHVGPHPPPALDDADSVVWPVRCAGSFNTRAVGDFIEAGAEQVQLVGCPPADCRYGLGNELASERTRGDRSPHVPRKWSGLVVEDWIAPTELEAAVANPGSHPAVDPSNLPARREMALGVGIVVGLSVVGIGLATRAPFSPLNDQAGVRVVVDHEPGLALEGITINPGPSGEQVRVAVLADGREVGSSIVGDGVGRAVGVVDVELPPGATELSVALFEGSTRTDVLREPVVLEAGRRLIVEIRDAPPIPGADEGRRLFNARTDGACNVCHSVEPGNDGVGPSLAGVATVAGERVEGLDAEQYLQVSILLPDQYIVEGYPAGQMLPIYRDRFTAEELDAVVAYLLTLEEVGS